MQLLIQCDEDCAQPASGVRTEDAKPLAVGRRGADRVGGGAVGIGVGAGISLACRPHGLGAGEAASDIGVADSGQALASRHAGGDGGQAFLGTAAVFLEMPRDQGINGGPVIRVKVAVVGEVVGHRTRLVPRPGAEGGDESLLVDETDLEARAARKRGRDRRRWASCVEFPGHFSGIGLGIRTTAASGDRPRSICAGDGQDWPPPSGTR